MAGDFATLYRYAWLDSYAADFFGPGPGWGGDRSFFRRWTPRAARSSSLRDTERCPQTMAVAGNELSSDEEEHGSRVWKRDGCMTDDQSRK
jgi:hypothetical protein